jgi:hypothetical protein
MFSNVMDLDAQTRYAPLVCSFLCLNLQLWGLTFFFFFLCVCVCIDNFWIFANRRNRGIAFPDVPPHTLIPHQEFSMTAGDFLEIYCHPSHAGSWDAVATCFFIDTAKNVLQYVEVLRKCIKVGGLWVNNGPLLWHFEDMKGVSSLELNWDELRHVITSSGFELLVRCDPFFHWRRKRKKKRERKKIRKRNIG